MAKLTGVQIRTLRKAMLDTFTTGRQWATLLQDVDRNLDEVSLASDLEQIAQDVIVAANDQGWLADLLQVAADERPHLSPFHNLVSDLRRVLGATELPQVGASGVADTLPASCIAPSEAIQQGTVEGSVIAEPLTPHAKYSKRNLAVGALIFLLSIASMAVFALRTGKGPFGQGIAPSLSPPLATAAPVSREQPSVPPSPAPTATATPTDQPLQVLNYRDGDQIPYSTSLLGTYSAEDQDKVIRVFIQPPPNADGSPAPYFPQSFNHCAAEDGAGNDGAVMVDGRWEQHVLVGTQDASEVGKPFSIFVTTATEEGDAAVVAEIQSWCPDKETYWPGFDELPVAEGGEVIRVPVVRSGEVDQAPDPSRAELPGQVTITEPQPGQAVGNEQVVGGTYSDLRDGDAVWVFVHTAFGKWFPQSNPCKGLQLTSVNGRWHATSYFGGQTGEPYEVVVVVADPEANAFFEQKQQEWCTAAERDRAFVWPGLTTIELPPGITEKDRIRVYQK